MTKLNYILLLMAFVVKSTIKQIHLYQMTFIAKQLCKTEITNYDNCD